MSFSAKHGPIELVKADITEMDTDAIVNPSNTSLVLGAGVSGAIRVKGGPGIQLEMDKIGKCPVGEAVATGAGTLNAKYVIHTVGPRMGEGDEETKLENATHNSLRLAEELGLSSIAFPAISTGIFGFPLERCAEIMLQVTLDYFTSGDRGLKRVVFCLWGDDAYNTFSATLNKLTQG